MSKLLVLAVLCLLPTLTTSAHCVECGLTPPQLGELYGYTVESHYVVTDDGYILCVHRIPPRNPGAEVVFLQHGLLDSSATWLLNGKTGSFGFILSDAGYDVWMGNVRGNTYTKNHTTIPVNSDKFWDFTFDEMNVIDLPNMIDYTLNVTGHKQLYYVGHSQGTLIGFTGFPKNADLAKKIKLFTALAPVGRVTHIKGMFHYMAKFQSSFEWFFKTFGVRQFLPSNYFIKTFAKVVCPFFERWCTNIIFIFAGYDRSNFNSSRIEIYESHAPADTSTKNLAHWSQMINAKKLQMYDYESVTKNMAHYGTPHPPEYNITGLSIPTVLVMGGNDWLSDPRDELWLIDQIGGSILEYFTVDYYNHFDFLWGEDAPKVIYRQLMEIMEKMKHL